MATPTVALQYVAPDVSATSWKRRILAVSLMLVIASYFWVSSRYPALYKKYSQGTHIKVTGEITFGTVYAVDGSMPVQTRVWRTTVNWLQANEIGMTFGFLFGSAALTLLGMLPSRRTRNRYLNALIGAGAGAPLGVCANCVAPIARGFYASGMSTESVFAAMFSSPTLNVIVLAMTFALFPLPIAGLKLATVLILIFLVAPMIGARQAPASAILWQPSPAASESWGEAFRSTVGSFAKSFWYVFRVGVPLMLLAALLGALAIELIPQNGLTAHTSLFGIVLVALIGTFLPVPIAFDVVIAYLAMTRGVPLPYVMTLLCTLGVYSVYSVLVVGKTISWKAALQLYGAVACLGVLAGLATELLKR